MGKFLIFYKVIKFQRMCINAHNAYIPHSLVFTQAHKHTHTLRFKKKQQKTTEGYKG